MIDKVQKIREEVEKLHGNPYYMMAVKDVLEILDMQKEPVKDRLAFKAIPRLLDMIEPSDRAKAYTAKLADALEVEGYSTDAKIVRESLKIMNGENVAMATMDEQPVSEDLEEAAEKDVCEVVNTCSAIGIPNDHIPSWVQDAMINEFIHGAKWQKQQDQSTIELAEDHAMLAGMEKMKKEMMKEPNLSGYVARDENGNLHIFEVEPRRLEKEHRWWDRDYNCHIIDNNAFPTLRWEDEPISVKLVIIKEG